MPYDVQIDRLPIFALFDLKGPSGALAAWAGGALPTLPGAPNTLSRVEGAVLCHLGPERWLLRADIGAEPGLEAALRPGLAPPEISIVKVSDTLRFFRVTGADAAEVVSIGCPLDLHPRVYGADAVSYTEFFGLKAFVLRCDGGFEVAVEQSFGDMIADYLARAMA